MLELRLHRSDVVLMHDRRVPGRRWANIDHIAIGPTGVTVIDTKSSRGRVQLATAGIINRREQLLVNGRERTSQLDSLQRQIEESLDICQAPQPIGDSVLDAEARSGDSIDIRREFAT
jgi:hypothetical protein